MTNFPFPKMAKSARSKNSKPRQVDPARSAQMALVQSKDTKPEMRVRKALHAAGLRYRLHDRNLPGSPDLVFASHGVVLFVHGCFWHRHKGCPSCRMPKSRLEFWQAKFEGNVKRDRIQGAALKRESKGPGWIFQGTILNRRQFPQRNYT
jgi:DNA mismatch endonuclease (patch repair protein)